jgi:ribosomal protein S27E
MSRQWNNEQLITAVRTSDTLKEAALKLGLKLPGGYKTLKKYLKILSVDTSHLKSKERSKLPRAPIEKVLCENSTYDYRYVKSRALQAGLLDLKCQECGIAQTWRGKPLSLHMDHINGINNDHRIENLRLLCPNCHSQTPTYCGRNVKHPRPQVKVFCSVCGVSIHHTSTTCRKCRSRVAKTPWPEGSVLADMVRNSNLSVVARQFGVSSNAVKKRLRHHNLWPL